MHGDWLGSFMPPPVMTDSGASPCCVSNTLTVAFAFPT
jgi:hypothetical protein